MSNQLAAHDMRQDAEVIGLVGLAHGTSHFYHLMLPPLFPWLMAEFDLTFTQAGLMVTTFFIVSGIGQALAGFVVDRIGARPVLFFGLTTLACSGLVLAASESYSMLLLTAAVAGLGNSIFHPADFTLLNQRVAPPRLGHAFSVHGLSGSLGWACAPVFMAGIAAAAGWHVAGLAASAVGFTVLAIMWVRRASLGEVAREVVAAADSEPVLKPHALDFLRARAVWFCFAFFFVTTGAFGVLQSFAPAILGEVYGIALALATSSLTAYLLGSALGIATGGFVAGMSARNEQVVAAALGCAAAVAIVLALGLVPAWTVLPLMAIMGFSVGMAGPSRDLLVRRAATGNLGGSSFGRVYGFVYSGVDIGLATAPVLAGPLLDAGHFQAALVAVAVLQVLAIAAAWRVAQPAAQARAAH